MEENQQELLFKFSMFEQQIRQLQEQLNAIEQGIVEMQSIHLGLDEIILDKEILSPLGRGVFAKAKIIDKELLVDIGNKNFVKKSKADTKELIKTQIGKLEEIKKDINSELDKLSDEITKTMSEAQSKGHEHNHSHGNCSHDSCSCGDDCECGEECECDDECKCDDEECKGKK